MPSSARELPTAIVHPRDFEFLEVRSIGQDADEKRKA
jgi:hypothetical protein